MKNHVWRPLYLALAIIILVLVARTFLVADDFGIQEQGYMYGLHRKGNEAEWKAVTVKYKTSVYCKECHQDKSAELSRSPHGIIACENCHGPALNHPDAPQKLAIDGSRELCLRCHFLLRYPSGARTEIRGIQPEAHYPGRECRTCHNPHHPGSRS